MTESKESYRFSITLSAEVYEWLKVQAGNEGRSLGNMAGKVLKEAITGTAEKTAYERGRRDGFELASNP